MESSNKNKFETDNHSPLLQPTVERNEKLQQRVYLFEC